MCGEVLEAEIWRLGLAARQLRRRKVCSGRVTAMVIDA